MVAQHLTCYDIEPWRGLLEFCTEDDGEPKVTLRTQQRLDFPGFTTPYSPCLSGKRVLGSMKELAL
jgi:hypothetical protein